jgi:two-component system, sensor histidine kinase and response regulator
LGIVSWREDMNYGQLRLVFILIILPAITCFGQQDQFSNPYIDSLKQVLKVESNSIAKVDLLNALAYNYYYFNHESTGQYARQAIDLATSVNYLKGLSEAQRMLGISFKARNMEKEAIQWLYKGLETAESIGYHQGIADNLNSIGIFFSYIDDFQRAISFYKRSVRHQILAGNKLREGILYGNTGGIYQRKGDLDSSLFYFEKSKVILDSLGDERWQAMINGHYGGLFIKMGEIKRAKSHSIKALELSIKNGQSFHLQKAYQNLAEIYLSQNRLDSAQFYADKNLKLSQEIGFFPYLIDAYEVTYKVSKALNQPQNALKYHEKYAQYKDSLRFDQINSEANLMSFQRDLEAKEHENQVLRLVNETQEAENKARQDIIQRQTVIVFAIVLILVIVTVAAIILFRLRLKEKEANQKLSRSNKDLKEQKVELSNMLQMVEHLNAQLQAQNSALNHSAIVSITDLEGNIISVNDNFCNVSGYTRDELLGRNKRILRSNEHSPEFFTNLWQTIKSGNSWRGEIKNRKKDGQFFWCDSAIAPVMDDNDNPKQYFSLQFDITPRKNYLNQLKDKSHELEELNKLKDRLLSIVSHDFRGPLNSLQGTLTLLLRGALTQEEFRLLTHDLVEKLDHTSNLLDNLLNWARSQMQGMKVYPKTVNLKVIADDCVNLLSPIAEKKLVNIHTFIDESMMVHADNEMVKLILRNLLSNSIKFSYPRSRIILSATKEDGKVVMMVKDEGLGMSNENQHKLFSLENFSTYGTSNEKGMGIGLLLCKDFVERNGGQIWFESELEKGTSFYFSLPTKEPSLVYNPS